MTATAAKPTKRKLQWFVSVLMLLVATPFTIGWARAANVNGPSSRFPSSRFNDASALSPDNASALSADNAPAAGTEDVAVKEVVAGFSNGWNTHDAHAMCIALADDVQWVNWRGEVIGSRKGVEDEHARLFADLYKNTHRTDTVKSIRYLGPELASVDDYWIMTGARNRDGSDWPYRAGYASFLMAKRAGRWTVIVSHTADFNAKAPAEK